jgi:precorrin-2 dehydrogenase/sirohydrochlorin ferrochelatase
MRSDVFPIGLKLEAKRCLVIGSGEEAERRARAFVAAGAAVSVVSILPTVETEKLADAGVLALLRRPFAEADLAGAWLAVYTDQDAAEARRIGAAANAERVFFCAVDQPADSSYSHMALTKAGPITVAVASNGRIPALARKLREELDRVFAEARLHEFAESLATRRDRTSAAERRSVLADAVREVHFEGRLVLQRAETATGEATGPKRS